MREFAGELGCDALVILAATIQSSHWASSSDVRIGHLYDIDLASQTV